MQGFNIMELDFKQEDMQMIPLMDVTRQYESIQDKLDEAALRVLHSGTYIMGPDVQEFEELFAAYVGTKYAVSVGNGTDALVITLIAAGVAQGDEVITSAMSFFATAEAIAAVGATPVFVDCTADTYTLDADKIEEKITDKTKAVIPVHLYGQCAEMDKINAIAKKHNLFVIEDAAQAAGAEYKGKKAGSLADAACFSFFPTKNLGCAGDGGIITTDNESIYKQCQAYRVHGSGSNGLYAYGVKKGVQVCEDSIDFHGNLPKYYNFVIGYNSRLDTLQAALLKEKLKYLDQWNQKRREFSMKYDKCISNDKLKKPVCAKSNQHIYYVYVLTTEKRDEFRAFMKEQGISTGVYFPVALHLQKVFEDLGYKKGDFPNAEYIGEHGAAIPMFPHMTEDEMNTVINAVNMF